MEKPMDNPMDNPTYRFLGMRRIDPLPHIPGTVAIITNSERFFSLPEEIFNELFEKDPRSQETIDAISAMTRSWLWPGKDRRGSHVDGGNCIRCLTSFTYLELRNPDKGTYPDTCPVCGYEGKRKPKKESTDD